MKRVVAFFSVEDFHTEFSSAPLQSSLACKELHREDRRWSFCLAFFPILICKIVLAKPLISFSLFLCLSHGGKLKVLFIFSSFISSDFKYLLGFTKLCRGFFQVQYFFLSTDKMLSFECAFSFSSFLIMLIDLDKSVIPIVWILKK